MTISARPDPAGSNGTWRRSPERKSSNSAWPGRECSTASWSIPPVGAPAISFSARMQAVLHSRPGHALLLDFRSGERRHVPFDPAGSGLALIVIDTRARHSLVDGQYAERRAACEEAARLLGLPSLREITDLDAALAALPEGALRRRVQHVVTETARVAAAVDALDRADIPALGPLFDASHTSLRDDYQVSCAELDLAVGASSAAGALGARMTGGGFGGSAIALVRADDVGRVTSAVGDAFNAAGFKAPTFLDATP